MNINTKLKSGPHALQKNQCKNNHVVKMKTINTLNKLKWKRGFSVKSKNEIVITGLISNKYKWKYEYICARDSRVHIVELNASLET